MYSGGYSGGGCRCCSGSYNDAGGNSGFSMQTQSIQSERSLLVEKPHAYIPCKGNYSVSGGSLNSLDNYMVMANNNADSGNAKAYSIDERIGSISGFGRGLGFGSSQSAGLMYSANNKSSIDNLISGYSGAVYTGYSKNANAHIQYASNFLASVRPITQFIDDAAQIQHYIRQTFKHIFGKDFPEDIIVKVTDKESMKAIHSECGGKWTEGIMGFAINNRPNTSEIFVMKGSLDRVILTIGHELGHVLSDAKKDKHNEEAKAFAFEFLWAKAVKENNIANLSGCISLDAPAENGLHNVSFGFVNSLLKTGKNAMEIYIGLIKNSISVFGNISYVA